MKRTLIILACGFLFLFNSCTNNLDENEIQLLEERMGGGKKWIINEISLDGVVKYKKGIPTLDPDFESPSEWLKFDTDLNQVEVKYSDSEDTKIFEYKLNGKNFTVIDPSDGYAEIMTIESGSIKESSMTISQKYESFLYIYKLIVE